MLESSSFALSKQSNRVVLHVVILSQDLATFLGKIPLILWIFEQGKWRIITWYSYREKVIVIQRRKKKNTEAGWILMVQKSSLTNKTYFNIQRKITFSLPRVVSLYTNTIPNFEEEGKKMFKYTIMNYPKSDDLQTSKTW